MKSINEKLSQKGKVVIVTGGYRGIGLAIVKHVALYHRGRVGVESPPGGGAEFHIVLPV